MFENYNKESMKFYICQSIINKQLLDSFLLFIENTIITLRCCCVSCFFGGSVINFEHMC